MMKKVLSIIIVSVMLIAMYPTKAVAVEILDSGSCGTSLTWTLDSNGLLTISGTGKMSDYQMSGQFYATSTSPWYDHRNEIFSIIIEDGVTSIGERAFSSCSSLRNVTIPSSVVTIGAYGFARCERMKEISISYGLQVVGEKAFDHCSSLSMIDLPASLREIGACAFCDSGLTEIALPEGLNSVGEVAFFLCKDLKKIEISSTVTHLGDRPFKKCSVLESIIVSSGNEFYCCHDGVLFNSDMTSLICYPAGKRASEYTIPNTVRYIAPYAFDVCPFLQAITIPTSVIKIESNAFDNYGRTTPLAIYYEGTQSQWENINIDEYNEALSETLMYYSDSTPDLVSFALTGGNARFDKTTGTVISGDKTITKAVIPNTISGVPVKKIGGLAFTESNSLTEVVLPAGLEEIGDFAFNKCRDLTGIEIPDGVTMIGEEAFYGCTSLAYLKLPESLSQIGNLAFEDCKGLTSLTLPASLKSMGFQAFANCSGLTTLAIPEGVRAISIRNFSGCSSLKTLYLPASISAISGYAFDGCKQLTDVFFGGSKAQWEATCMSVGNEYDFNLRYNASVSDFYAFINGTVQESPAPAPASASPAASGTTLQSLQLSGVADYDAASEVFQKLNSLRKDAGLSPLIMDKQLQEVAMQRAAELLIYYGHERPDGSDCFTAFPSHTSAGENIAYGQATAAAVMQAWTNSPGHYGNMVGTSFTAVGIGCFQQDDSIGWVQVFTGGGTVNELNRTGKITETYSVAASEKNLKLEVIPARPTVVVGETLNFQLKNVVNRGLDKTVDIGIIPSWSNSSQPSVVTVSADGTAKAISEGTATVKIGLSESLCVEVNMTVAGTGQGMEVHFGKSSEYYQGRFSDVTEEQWFAKNVAEAYEFGLMKGNSESTFYPDGEVTLAEAITMAARIYCIYATGSDRIQQGNPWYQAYLEYAHQNDIINDTYYHADVSQPATRAQFAEIFSRALPDTALPEINTVKENAIPDVSISASYAQSVYRLYRAGILTGSDAMGTFLPQTHITRAEAAAIVSRMADSSNRVSFDLSSVETTI